MKDPFDVSSYDGNHEESSLRSMLDPTNNGVVVGRSLTAMKERIDEYEKLIFELKKAEMKYLASLLKDNDIE